MAKITVIDAIMGTGKSSWAIQEMNSNTEESYIYCTPFLTEIERIKERCSDRKFYDPKRIDGKKIEGFNHLLMSGKDIALTHSAFSKSNSETMQYLEEGNYCLILDEVLDILVDFNDVANNKIKKGDINVLLKKKFISVDEYGKVSWIDDSYPDAQYSDVERLAKSGSLFYLDKSLLVWQFPPQIFHLFKKVYVLTYLFEGSFLKPYFEYHELEYEMASIGKQDGVYSLIPYSAENENREQFRELIKIFDNKSMNDYKNGSLSKTWYKRADKQEIKKLKGNIYNYIHNITKAKAMDIMWSCPKDYEKQLKGSGYTQAFRLSEEDKRKPEDALREIKKKSMCFVPCNERATNIYKNRSVCVYAINMYQNPYVKRYFSNKNKKDGTSIEVNEQYFALSCMLQWIWRSRIREHEPISIYIPSTRMRGLLEDWISKKW